ncbi:MAG: thiopurine S-methyltransferase [Sneathiella sp.]|nr:MAG: thiopurine S-methyltransferase [Sneathiella sp.]
MDADYWHQKWEKNNIGFHQSATNHMLENYFNRLSLAKGSRVFVPLCGKTLDIAWLLSNSYRVVGAELSELAITQLFAVLEIEPNITVAGKLKLYSADNIDIFVGDFFDVTGAALGPVNAIYDRAALVALPEGVRDLYRGHLVEVTEKAPQLLLTFDYDQELMKGPPFSISTEDVNRYYGKIYEVTPLGSRDVRGGLKGICAATENAWLLQ